MSEQRLPRPVTSTDQYLAAVLGELQKLNKQLAPQPADKGLPEAIKEMPKRVPAPKKVARKPRKKPAAKKAK